MKSRIPTYASLALLPLLTASALAPARLADRTLPLTVQAGSRIWIEGDSNLHEWACEATRFDSELRVDRAGPGAPPTQIELATVTVPVTALECGHGKMNDNLRKAMDARTHPTIRFELTRAQVVDPGIPGSVEALATGRLTVAGTTRELSMHVSGSDTGAGALRLQGSVRIRMSDWGVQPPSAMLGLLKTDDEMTILIDLFGAYAAAGGAASPAS